MAQQQQRYRVIQKIASGGMAEVFRAESAGLEGFKKTVAIKRVLPHLAEKKQFIGMFLDEARLSATLSHSNCVQVFDIGVGDNTYFIVMEYVDGADLKAVIEYQRTLGRPIAPEVAALVCIRICEGLSYAHELKDGRGVTQEIVHRDMSPPNVLITKFGEVKIVDFGLAKANSQLEKSEPGIIKGKFSYLSPEAALGQRIDARTDIFAVGIILWEMLAGRRLFLGDTDLETVKQVQAARIPPLKQFNPQVTPELEQVVARALARDPTQRYQMARDLGRDLNTVLFRYGRPVSSFDIAALVQPIVDARQSDLAKSSGTKKSIIGSLIEEALFEFTSLQEREERSSVDLGSAPLSIDGFNPAPDWAGDLGFGGGEGRDRVPSGQFELGNLAALEDDDVGRAPPSSVPISVQQPVPSAPAPISAPQPAPPAPLSAPTPQKSGGRGGLVAVLLLMLLVAGAAGAWFFGLIPGLPPPPR